MTEAGCRNICLENLVLRIIREIYYVLYSGTLTTSLFERRSRSTSTDEF